MKFTIAFFLMAFTLNISAQFPVTIPGSEVRKIKSSIVAPTMKAIITVKTLRLGIGAYAFWT